MLTEKKIICTICGKEIWGKTLRRKYCSECRVALARTRAHLYYVAMSSTEEGRAHLREADRRRKYEAYHKDVKLARKKMRDYRLRKKAQKVS